MKRIFKNWPWFLVLFGLAASIGLSARSWDTVDLVNFPLQKEGPFFTFFTKGSSLQVNFSKTQHCYYFGASKPREPGDGHSRPSSVRSPVPGFHKIGISVRSRESQVILGKFSLKRAKGNRTVFYLTLPIWFILFGGSLAPLAIWWWAKKMAAKGG